MTITVHRLKLGPWTLVLLRKRRQPDENDGELVAQGTATSEQDALGQALATVLR